MHLVDSSRRIALAPLLERFRLNFELHVCIEDPWASSLNLARLLSLCNLRMTQLSCFKSGSGGRRKSRVVRTWRNTQDCAGDGQKGSKILWQKDEFRISSSSNIVHVPRSNSNRHQRSHRSGETGSLVWFSSMCRQRSRGTYEHCSPRAPR